MNRQLRLACAAALSLACFAFATDAATHETAFDLDRLMAVLAKHSAGTVRFTEIKTTALLKQPIEVTGTLTYIAPARLERHTLTPREERFVIDRDTLAIERPAQGQRMQLQLRDYPALQAFAESLRGTLSGDLAALRRFYRVELDGAWDDWRLILLPSDAQMAELVQRVLIAGSEGNVRRIELLETSGDRSVTTIHAR